MAISFEARLSCRLHLFSKRCVSKLDNFVI